MYQKMEESVSLNLGAKTRLNDVMELEEWVVVQLVSWEKDEWG
jgi:hypothetical protein